MSPPGSLHTRVLLSFTVSFSVDIMVCITASRFLLGVPAAANHEIVCIIDDASGQPLSVSQLEVQPSTKRRKYTLLRSGGQRGAFAASHDDRPDYGVVRLTRPRRSASSTRASSHALIKAKT